MDEHLIISLAIADKKYPLRIKREEEEAYRRAAKEINYKLSQYKQYFTGEDSKPLQDIDYMAMTALQAVTGKSKVEIKAELFENRIKKLTDELDDYLKKNVR